MFIAFLLPLLFIPQSDADHALVVHNEARAAVGVPPLVWSDELARDAQAYADHLAATEAFEHAETEFGENLYWSSGRPEGAAEQASVSWLSEVKDYHHVTRWHRNFSEVGHYTQMVWHATREVGMGVAISESGETYVVARYFPPGNYLNEMPY